MKVSNHQASQKIADANYLASVQKRLQHFWCPARAVNAHATVTFRINKSGNVSWLELTDAACDTGANFSALDAVVSSSPFSPLSSSNFRDIAASFDSTYLPRFRPAFRRASAHEVDALDKLESKANDAKNLKHLDDALHIMQEAHEALPSNIRVRDNLVNLYIECAQSKPVDRSMSLLRQSLLLDPTNKLAREKLNALLASNGKDPKSYQSRLQLARDYELAGQYDDALCEYGEAWLLKNDPDLIFEINLACQRRENYAGVAKWQDAIKLVNRVDYHIQLGEAYENCDDPDKAMAEYRLALTMDPAERTAQSNLARLQYAISSNSNDNAKLSKTELREDFLYAPYGHCTVSVAAIQGRKASIDYLKAACGDKMTRWASNQTAFRLYVDNGAGVQGYRADYRQIMIDAFDTWIKASESRLTFRVVDKASDANIACYWVPRHTKDMKSKELGLTKWQYVYHKSDPQLLMPQSAVVTIITLSPDSYQSINDSAMKAICMHELGHTLGITGHSPFVGDVMYASLSPFDIPAKLSDHDIATIRHLYQGYSHPH